MTGRHGAPEGGTPVGTNGSFQKGKTVEFACGYCRLIADGRIILHYFLGPQLKETIAHSGSHARACAMTFRSRPRELLPVATDREDLGPANHGDLVATPSPDRTSLGNIETFLPMTDTQEDGIIRLR